MWWLVILIVWVLASLFLLLFVRVVHTKGRCSAADKCGEHLCPHYQSHYIYEDCERFTVCKVGGKFHHRKCG